MVSKIKYTDQKIRNILNNYNLELIEYINTKNIISKDNGGYKYKITLHNLLSDKTPNKFMKNPFALENFKLFLSKNYPDYKLLDDQYVDCKTKMRFICIKHMDKGIQLNTLTNIIHNHHTCKYCSYDKLHNDRIIDENLIIKRANELNVIYKDRFIKDNETWISYICPVHADKGIQTSSWTLFKSRAKGCAYCTGRYKTTEDFKKELSTINSMVEIIGEYKGSERPVKCRCKLCNHIWSPIGRSLKNGQGCPNCSTSKGELKVKEFLDIHKLNYIQQKTFEDCIDKERLKFDFYLPNHNTAIEYDGQQHFMPVDFANKGKEWANNLFQNNVRKDNIKDAYCKDNNINLIRIPYFEYDNIFDILASKLTDVIFMQEFIESSETAG